MTRIHIWTHGRRTTERDRQRTQAAAARRRDLQAERATGLTLQQIAANHGISRQRVHQILNRDAA